MNWQQQYESGTIPWDKGGAHPALIDHLSTHGPLTGRILVPGCGFGYDVAALAAAGADEVIGLDIAPSAVEGAGLHLAPHPNARAILGDLFTECHGPLAGTMDWVWEHTCYCAIPPDLRPAWRDAVAAALKPGGHLLAVFYLNPWDPDEDQTQGPPFGTSTDALDEIVGARFTLLESRVPARTYPGREGKELLRLLQRRD